MNGPWKTNISAPWRGRDGRAALDRSDRRVRRRRVALDVCAVSDVQLEDRTLLSTNFPLSPTTWTAIGPAPVVAGQVAGTNPVSGRLTGVAADPSNANILYVAAAGGGVWKTIDGGTNWTALTDAQQTLSMGAIAVAPSNGQVIYAGTGEANNSVDSNYGVGILKSTDAGATWNLLTDGGVFNGLTTSRIAIDPTNSNIVYAAMGNFGANLSGTPGVYKSTDGGTTWTNTTASINTGISYTDVVVDPTTTTTVFMAAGYIFGSSSNGIYKSTNSGGTWSLVYNDSGGTNLGRIAIAIAPSNDNDIYASIAGNLGSTGSGVYQVVKSTTGGGSGTWSTITPGAPNYMGAQGWYDQWIAVKPTDPTVLFLAGSAGTGSILESTNSGASYTAIDTGASGNNGPHADHHAVVFDSSGRLVEGDDGGIWRLDNATIGSILWTDLNGSAANNALNTIQFTGTAVNPFNPDQALGGSQDNGSERFTDNLGWALTDFGDGGKILYAKGTNNLVYRVSPQGSFGPTNYFRKSTDGGATWSNATSGVASGLAGTNFYPEIAIDPSNDQRVFIGGSSIVQTINGAATWTTYATPNVGGFNPSSLTVNSIAVAPSNGSVVYAALGTSTIFVTTNNGTSWTNVSIAGAGRINELDVDPTNSSIAYAVVSNFGVGHVWRTINGGTSWTNISGNLPNLPTWALKIDPNNTATLYIGNDTGVYKTTNTGTSWTKLASGLPNVQVFSLDLEPQLNILAAGTHGRGMFELLTQATLPVNITAVPTSGTFGVSSTFTISVAFNSVVHIVGANPSLSLSSGGTATYVSGGGSNTLVFSYTTQYGQTTSGAKLDVTAINLNGGSLLDPSNTPATLTVPTTNSVGSLSANDNIIIDAVAPVILNYRVLFGAQSFDLLTSSRVRLPWAITGIQVTFSKPISQADAASLGGIAATSISGLGTNTITWTFGGPITIGSFATTLAGAGGDAVKDQYGNALAQGSGFAQSFKVLQGDTNDDGVVNAADLVIVNLARTQPYNIFADINGDGVVNAADVQLVRTKVGTSQS